MFDFLWIVFELLVTVGQSFIIMHFICSFLRHDYKSVKGKIIYISGAVLFTATVTFMNYLTIYEGIYGLIYVIEFFVFGMIFLKGSISKKLFVAVLTNIILVCVNALVSGTVSSAFKEDISQIYTEKTLSRFLMILIVNILYVYIFEIILKLTAKREFMLKSKEWVLIVSVFGTSFVSIAFIHMAQLSDTKLLLISELGIIIVNVICFYMISALSKSNKETTELKLYRQQQEYRLQYAENIKKQYEEIRRIRHDMKQNFAVINALQKEQEYDEAVEYTNKCADKLSRFEDLIDVGNDFVNAILNTKLSLAKENDIEVICSASKNIAGIEDIDLCNLFGNMLDNAIEACEKCIETAKLIEIQIVSDEYKLLITVSNTVSVPVLIRELKTDKPDSEMHGFGIKTIKSIAKKYNGTVDFYEENHLFNCQVLLYK